MPATKTKKDERINFRTTEKTKLTVEKAASICDTTMSNFITQAALSEARAVIQKHQKITLSETDRDIFLALLEEDTPNENLRSALEAHNKLID